MAEELITYGMVRGKGYTVSVTKQDSEYAIKEDFQSGGAVGVIPLTNLSGYESNELIENSSIPSYVPYFHIKSNKLSAKVYMSNASIPLTSNPSNLVSMTVSIGLNEVALPVTVGTRTGGIARLTIGDRIYFYGDPPSGTRGNISLGNYIIAEKGVATITFPTGGGGVIDPDPIDPDPIDPEPTSSMTINFSGVSFSYSYAFVTGIGFITDLPMMIIQNGANTFDIPMTVYDIRAGKSQKVSSGTVSIYRKPFSGNWEYKTAFSVVAGSNISVDVT